MPLGSVILISNNLRATSEHLVSIPWPWRFMGFMLALDLFLVFDQHVLGVFLPLEPRKQHWEVWKCGSLRSEQSENTEQTWAQPSPDGFSGPVRGAAALKA